MTFAVGGVTMTMESAASSGLTLFVTYDPQELEMLAGWLTFTVSGDSTVVTNVFVQTYADGDLFDEVYLPSGELEDINEEIAETAPFEPAAAIARSDCWIARLNALNKAITAGALQVVAMATFNYTAINMMMAAYAQYYSALLEVACVCKSRCFEYSPSRSGLDDLALYRPPSFRATSWALAVAGAQSSTCTLARGTA